MTSQDDFKEAVKCDPVVVDFGKCDFCGSCVGICPPDCIELTDCFLRIISATCIRCWLCIPACPVGALSCNNNDGFDISNQLES